MVGGSIMEKNRERTSYRLFALYLFPILFILSLILGCGGSGGGGGATSLY